MFEKLYICIESLTFKGAVLATIFLTIGMALYSILLHVPMIAERVVDVKKLVLIPFFVMYIGVGSLLPVIMMQGMSGGAEMLLSVRTPQEIAEKREGNIFSRVSLAWIEWWAHSPAITSIQFWLVLFFFGFASLSTLYMYSALKL